MGILGDVRLARRFREVIVGTDSAGNEVKLKVYAPKLGLIDRVQGEIPDPPVPVTRSGNVLRDRRGQPVKDDKGQPIMETTEHHDDPDYVAACARVEKARSIAMLLECLEDQIQPSVKREGLAPLDYYLKVWEELEDAGIGLGSFNALTNACEAMTQPMTVAEVALAKIRLGTDEASQEGVAEGK